MKKYFYLITLTTIALLKCGSDLPKQELVNKMRGLGTRVTPLATAPSTTGQLPQTVTLTLYGALPLGQTATLTPYTEANPSTSSEFPLSAQDMEIVSNSLTYTDHTALRIVSAQATIKIPTLDELEKFSGGSFTGAPLGYSFQWISADNTEKVHGNFPVYPAGSASLQNTEPTISITSPTSGNVASASGSLSLTSTLSQFDNMIVGWFVSSGEIINRRSQNSTWNKIQGGPQTLILTARVQSNGAFAYQVVDVQGP